MNVLIGDIGGTCTRLALIKIISPDDHKEIKKEFYETKLYSNLEEVLDRFLKDSKEINCVPERALLACAGSPIDQSVRFKNVDWTVYAHKIESRFNLKSCSLINDFTAKGYSILNLKQEDILTLQPYEVKDTKTKVVIGPGTGLGVSTVQEFKNKNAEKHFLVRGTEYGHTSFGAINPLEAEFVQFYLTNVPKESPDDIYLATEKAFCGPSVPWIYKFFCKRNETEPKEYSSKEIFEKGLEMKEIECKETLDFFCRVYGRLVGDIALTTMPYGGIFLVGKMSNAVIEYIKNKDSPFLNSYYSKGSITNKVLEQFPIYIVKKETLGLYGATIKIQRDIYGLDPNED